MTFVENRICCDRSLMSALKAMIDTAMLDFTELFAPAPWTDESIRPAKGEKKLTALLFRLKSLHEFDKIYWLLLHLVLPLSLLSLLRYSISLPGL